MTNTKQNVFDFSKLILGGVAGYYMTKALHMTDTKKKNAVIVAGATLSFLMGNNAKK